jgi:elongation factor Ts
MEITAEMVKTLRHQSGAGIMECKQALAEAKGSIEEAVVVLRKKGLAKASKKEGRETGEGIVGAYIHTGGKVGVLVELNCETDFVANTDEFRELLKDVSMHIAAAKPRFISRQDVTAETLAKEREIYAHQVRESGKPANMIDKIVDGKMNKFYEENCLLDQAFIKNPEITITELIKQKIAKLGENITVGNFSRFEISK